MTHFGRLVSTSPLRNLDGVNAQPFHKLFTIHCACGRAECDGFTLFRETLQPLSVSSEENSHCGEADALVPIDERMARDECEPKRGYLVEHR